MTNSNLESFFKSHNNVHIISDYEGEQIKSEEYNSSNGLIICGDILDSTVGFGFQENFNKSTGDINDIKKVYNLRNIVSIVNNKNIHLIFGNRDVNKFKCKYLTKMKKYQKGDIYYNFNRGNINLSEITYTDLKISKIEWVVDTKHWYPFWNKDIKKYLEYWEKTEKEITKSIDNTEYGENQFLKRFYRIFGTDGPQGTMSASNLLYTIPLEVGINLDNKKLNNLAYLDYLAFVVLAVFRVMGLFTKNPSNENNITSIGTKKNLNTTILLSLLNRFYSGLPNTSFVSYFDDKINNRLYIFSHGGITSTLINNFETDRLKSILTEQKKNLTLTGGTPTIIELDKLTIMTKLNEINLKNLEIMRNTLNKSKEYNYIPNIDMLLALSISASYIPPVGGEIFILNSSITPGIDIMENEKNIFFCTDSELIQIFGHVPKGFATNFSKFKNNDKNTYLINLDYSQSFRYTRFGGKTDSVLIFKLNELKDGPILKSQIDLSKITRADTSPDVNFIDSNYYTDVPLKTQMIKTNDNQHILDSRFINDFQNFKPNGIFRYHGIYKDDITGGDEYYVFTILKGFQKELYLTKIVNDTSAKLKYYKYKRKYLELKNYILINSKV